MPEWDAGKPVDPLEKAMAEGEPVDEPELPDAAPDRPSGEDAGAR